MSDYYNITQEKINKYNLNWLKLLGHPERILIIEDSDNKMMMFIALLIKNIYILKIHLKQNINILLTSMKISVLKNSMTQRLMFDTQMIWRMFIKIVQRTT